MSRPTFRPLGLLWNEHRTYRNMSMKLSNHLNTTPRALHRPWSVYAQRHFYTCLLEYRSNTSSTLHYPQNKIYLISDGKFSYKKLQVEFLIPLIRHQAWRRYGTRATAPAFLGSTPSGDSDLPRAKVSIGQGALWVPGPVGAQRCRQKLFPCRKFNPARRQSL
jgi:hypothetical protein